MALKLTNNAVSTLAGAIAATDTTFSIAPGDGTKFPTLDVGDWHPLTLIKSDGSIEIVRCTARTTDTFTVQRAQESTAALAFAAGDHVDLRLTAAALGEFLLRDGSVAMIADLNANSHHVTNLLDPVNPQDGATKNYTDTVATGKVSKAGDTMTGALTISNGDLYVASGSVSVAAANSGAELGSVSASNTPYIDFHSSGNNIDYDVRLIASGGNASIGNGTLNINAASVITSGDFASSSDERLKADWQEPGRNFVKRLARVQRGTYTRKDSGRRQVGVSAQDMRRLLPKAVNKDKDGNLNLAYGQAAMVSAVELAIEHEALKAYVRTLERRLRKLERKQ
jgi:hypothetical protein